MNTVQLYSKSWNIFSNYNKWCKCIRPHTHTILIMTFLFEHVRKWIVLFFWWNMVKKMLGCFKRKGFGWLYALIWWTIFSEHLPSAVNLRCNKLDKSCVSNSSVGWRKLTWKQKNTILFDKCIVESCIRSRSDKQKSDLAKR